MFGRKQRVRLYSFQGGLRTADEIRTALDELEEAFRLELAAEDAKRNG